MGLIRAADQRCKRTVVAVEIDPVDMLVLDSADPKDKRNVRADENLLAVFDGKKVISMFEMTKLVNGHLV